MNRVQGRSASITSVARWLLPLCALSIAAQAALGQVGDETAASDGFATDVAVASLTSALETARAKQQALAQQATSLEAERAQARHELGTQVRALYRITHPGLSPAVGGMSGVLRHVGRVKRLRRIVEREARGLEALEQRAVALRLASGKAAQELDQAQLRLSAMQAAPREASGSQREQSHYGIRIVDGSPLSNFESERGRLSSPVAGDVHIVASTVAESDGPGLAFQAPVGTPVRAVAPGRVAFADRYGGYGQLVILDHGNSYYTAYGGLGAIDVRVGQDLPRQARIGEIGEGLTPPALFFEVRRGSRTLDPMSWFGY